MGTAACSTSVSSPTRARPTHRRPPPTWLARSPGWGAQVVLGAGLVAAAAYGVQAYAAPRVRSWYQALVDSRSEARAAEQARAAATAQALQSLASSQAALQGVVGELAAAVQAMQGTQAALAEQAAALVKAQREQPPSQRSLFGPTGGG